MTYLERAGALELIDKPFKRKELIETVERHLIVGKDDFLICKSF